MINFDLFKVFLDPKELEKIAKKMQNNPELKRMYDDALKENPELDGDVDALFGKIFGGKKDD